MKLTNPKTHEQIESRFSSDAEAGEFLSTLVSQGEFGTGSRAEFPSSLLQALGGKYPLSEGRAFWLHKLANEGGKKPQAASGTFNLAGLRNLFSKAAEKLKRPAIILTIPGTSEEVKVSLAGAGSRYHGQLMIAAPEFGSGIYYGRVDTEGNFFAGRSDSSPVRSLLSALAADPAATAAAHGHLTGACAFCRKSLTDPRSLQVGYGKICASKFGLAW